MILRPAVLADIEAGRVDLAFRRWDQPRVRVGTRLRTRVGLVEVTSLDEVDVDALSDADARRAGATSLAVLREALAERAERPAWRVGLRHAGPDPREALREQVPDATELAGLRSRLDRLDRSSTEGPWTAVTLALVDDHPGRRAPELAAEVGRETAPFKRDVRKLKELGLTESLDIGYRLSPRGSAVVDALLRDAWLPPRRRPRTPSGTPLPRGIGAPATRALRAAGLDTLQLVATRSREEVADLHGVGPVALERLDALLAGADLGWAAPG